MKIKVSDFSLTRLVIYVGDSKNVINRVKTNHCAGNVEGSAFRKLIAEYMGYSFIKTRRKSGSTRTRIDLPQPKLGETAITKYIRSGYWRYFVCDSIADSQDFQWFAIDKLNPLLNLNRRNWNVDNESRYNSMLSVLTKSKAYTCEGLQKLRTGPGVYVFFHKEEPNRDMCNI